MQHKFLLHDTRDNVGVAVIDIKAGEPVLGVSLEDQSCVEVTAINDIPLGHKIALVALSEGSRVIKYGTPVGLTKKAILAGEHVHVHNLKSARW